MKKNSSLFPLQQEKPLQAFGRSVLAIAFTLIALQSAGLGQSAPPVAKEKKNDDSTSEKSQTDSPAVAANTGMRTGADHFMRVRKDRKGRPVSLDTSITRYELKNADGEVVTIDLIGAVHIGEKSYYEALNRRFETYDGLLYELVAPEGTVIPKGGRSEGSGGIMNPIAALQKGMQSITGLEFQLEHIDYTKENFIHADMSPEEFSESMKNNGESISGYALKAIGQSMAMQASGQGDQSIGMLMAMFSKNKKLRMRRAMAKQIRQMESGMAIFEGKDGSTIINHRNAKCFEVLEKEIAAGKTRLGIFYGAGHLADMDRRLLSDMKAQRGGQVWLPAWTLTKRVQPK